MKDDYSQIYNLSQSLIRHQKAVRSIAYQSTGLLASGSMDNTVCLWIKTGDNFEFLKETYYHHEFVYVVRSTLLENGFFSGSKDKKIFLMDNEGNPLSEFIGHTGAVNSISQSTPSKFISGSWDATAAIWDVETGKQIDVLKGHSHAVTVLAIAENHYITSSEDKVLRFWENSTCYKEVKGAHNHIVRDIKLSPCGNFIYTTSNDQTIKLWTLDGELIEEYENAHDGFIFTLAVNNDYLFSGGDDCVVRMWKGKERVSNLYHPNTVWDLCFDKNDLITGKNNFKLACGDGIIRVFSNDPNKFLPSNDIKAYNEHCIEAMKKYTNQDGQSQTVDLADCPDVSLINEFVGKEGEIKVFNNQGNPEAYVYKESLGQWQSVGRNLGGEGSNGKRYYQGDAYFKEGEYDHIFDIELFGRTMPLPFNKGDNVTYSTQNFLKREKLQITYTDPIRNHINDSLSGQSHKKDESKNPNKTSTTTTKPKITTQTKFKFPIVTYNLFDKIGTDVSLNKLLEFNTKLAESDETKELCISSTEETYFKRFAGVIANTGYYHNSLINELDYQVLTSKLKSWPNNYIIPLLDFYRMFFIHPRSHDFFKKSGEGINELVSMLNRFKDCNDNGKILILRILNNFFAQEYPRVFISEKRNMVIEAISICIDSENNHIRSAISSLLFNYSVLLYDKNNSEAAIQMISIINEMLLNEKVENTVIFLLSALGNLMFQSNNNINIAKDIDLGSTIDGISIESHDSDVQEEINEHKKFLKNLLSC